MYEQGKCRNEKNPYVKDTINCMNSQTLCSPAKEVVFVKQEQKPIKDKYLMKYLIS